MMITAFVIGWLLACVAIGFGAWLSHRLRANRSPVPDWPHLRAAVAPGAPPAPPPKPKEKF